MRSDCEPTLLRCAAESNTYVDRGAVRQYRYTMVAMLRQNLAMVCGKDLTAMTNGTASSLSAAKMRTDLPNPNM